MTTFILDPQGRKRSEGKNLAIMFRYAQKCGGVKRITVNTGDWGYGHVTVDYANGWSAVTKFSSYSHACDWAHARSALGKASWFSGCEVVIHNR